MNVNLQLMTNAYKSGRNVNTNMYFKRKAQGQTMQHTLVVNNGHMSMKRMLKEADKNQNSNFMASNNILSNAMSYSEKLKAQRENAQNASLEKKKLKYQFKDISSQIIRSKTSQAARQAVGQARRELLRLKQEKQSGKYDSEEIEAAISHAKAMERVAKKKVKHLEEEEIAKAAGGVCAEVLVEQEKALEDDKAWNEDELAEDELYEEELTEEEQRMADEQLEFSSEDIDAMLEDMSDLSSELMEELDEGMRDMLEEMGLGEMSDSLAAVKGDMDPADLKMMKIKHRCKEMKEIVKADSEYLKAVFKHLEAMKSGGIGVSTGGNAGGMAINSSPAMPTISVSAGEATASVIDVSV